MSKHIVSLFLLCLLLASIPCFGQLQRLIIPEFNFLIDPPEEFGTIITYCLDFGRSGPRAGVEYRYLLSSPDTARVVVEGRELSLQQAVDEHVVRIEAVAPSVRDFNQQVRAYQLVGVANMLFPASALHDFQSMSSSHQKQFLSRHQNFHSLRIVNLSKKQVRLSFKNAILGAAKEGPPDWKIPSIPAGGDIATVQSTIWMTETQQRLVAQGFNIRVSGTLDAETKAALLKFQKAHNLRPTGTPTIDTIRALRGSEQKQ